jgi:hypothetical protein
VEADGAFAPSAARAGDMFGASIATGDFNGDGIDDFAVGAPTSERSIGVLANQGSVQVYFGRLGLVPPCPVAGCSNAAGGTPTTFVPDVPDLVIWGGSAGAQFGLSLARAGNVDSVPGEELVVGGQGSAVVVAIASATTDEEVDPWLTLERPVAGDPFGRFVGAMSVGGQRLLWVGGKASVHVYREPAGGWAGLATSFEPSLSLHWNSGTGSPVVTAASAAGDWNDDGFPDLAVGCSECSVALKNLKVFDGSLLLGSNDLLGDTSDALGQYAGVQNSRTASSLAVFPNGRLAVGSTHFSSSNGRLMVFDEDVTVDGAGVLAGPMATMLGTNGGKLGTSVAVGDPNQDGMGDVVGGAPEAALSGARRGMVRFGQAPGPSGTINSPMFMWGPQHTSVLGSGFGTAVAVGDVNGDLFDDMLMGAPRTLVGGFETGAVYLVLGGSAGYHGNEVVQFPDSDSDGYGLGFDANGNPLAITRCRLLDGYSTQARDCADDNPARAPENLELCEHEGDEDCIAANDHLCTERIGSPDDKAVEPTVSIQGSTWCYGDASWQIGPAGETASIQGLVQMLADEELFFDDFDAGIVGAMTDAGTCPPYIAGGAVVRLEVMETFEDDAAVATSKFAGLMTDTVVTVLRNHADGYIIGSLSTYPPVIGIVGGSYPGLVNGVVELLRATEGGAPWGHRTVLDWPENRQRRILSSLDLLACSTTPDPLVDDRAAVVSWHDWETCEVAGHPGYADAARDTLDLALRYHFSVVHGNELAEWGAWNEMVGKDVTRDASYIRELVLYLRRRGIDYDMKFRVLPNGFSRDFEPLGVYRMPFESVPTYLGDMAFPCDSDLCDAMADEPNFVYSRKYVMGTTEDPAGPPLGVVFARNFLVDPVLSGAVGAAAKGQVENLACTPSAVRAASAGQGPRFCVAPGSSVSAGGDSFTLADNGSATLFLGDRLLVTPLGTPDPQRDDSWYDMWKDPSAQDGGSWAKTAFRPGRLYALHFHAQRTDATVSPPDTDANEGDTDYGDADGAPVSPKDTAAEAVSLADVNIHVYMPGTAKVSTLVSLTADSPSREVGFVFRAPLQYTELPAFDAAGYTNANGVTIYPYAFDPAIQIYSYGEPASSVRFTDVTLVELDGLSSGWVLDEFGDPALKASSGQVVAEPALNLTSPNAPVLIGCGVFGDCVPYETAVDCGGASPLGFYEMDSYERFVRHESGGSVSLAADRLSRLRVPSEDLVGGLEISGVVKSIMGSYPQGYCDHGKLDAHADETVQSVEVLDRAKWGHGDRSLPDQLRFIAEPRSFPSGVHTLKDYLFGTSTSSFRWHTSRDVIFTNILSEVRSWNLGFAAWRDGIYAPVTQHQLARALFCNVANVVNDPDWTDSVVPFRSYAEFANSMEHPEFSDLPSLEGLAGSEPCDLIGTGSSGFRVSIDANMYLDSTTFNFIGSTQAHGGSLTDGYMQADLRHGMLTRPEDATVSNTLAPNVDTLIWNYWSDPHDIFENLCDVTDVSDVFYDHPGLGGVIEATASSRNACMMTPLPEGLPGDPMPPGVPNPAPAAPAPYVYGKGDVTVPDSVQNWSAVAAGHPEIMDGVEVVVFNSATGNGRGADPTDPWWGYAGRCMWNPGEATFAAVSFGNAAPSRHGPPALFGASPDTRWCLPGTAWSSLYRGAVFDYYGLGCGDFGGAGLEENDCVWMAQYPTGGGYVFPPLRMGIQPDTTHAG